MRKIYSALIAIMLMTSGAAAQDVIRPKQAQSGTALLFSLHGLGKLGADNVGRLDQDTIGITGGAGVKFFISNNLALRLALGFYANTETIKPISGNPALVDEKTSLTVFSLMPGVEYHPLRTGSLSGYVGGQILFVSAAYTTEGVGFAPNTKEESTYTRFGAGGFLGVEWHAFTGVSLSAEYQLMFLSTSGKNTYDGTSSDAPAETAFGLTSASGATLTLAFYL